MTGAVKMAEASTLLFTPTYRLEDRTVEALLAVRSRAQRSGRSLDILLTTDNPHGHQDRGRRNILHNFRKARRVCLAEGYDQMLVIESDVVPPADVLERLEALGADVAYGLYAFRVSSEAVNVFWRHTKRGVPGRNPGSTIANREDYAEMVRRGQVIDCSGGGTGCVLVRRRVLEAVDFRLDPAFDTTRYRGGFHDTYFTRDVYQAGFVMKADLSVVCGHVKGDGEVLWPPETDQWRQAQQREEGA